jgi:hypothetical protein
VRDFEASKAGRFVQSKDKQSGLPLWMAKATAADGIVRAAGGSSGSGGRRGSGHRDER